MDNNYNTDIKKPAEQYTEEERIAVKYRFLRDKILFHFERGSRYLLISKIVAAVLFLAFTVAGIAISHRTSRGELWLQVWVLAIFFNVTVFVIADYTKYLIESKVIPYLKDDEQIEFGEYDIFLEDIDGESDDEED
ncbi:MAG: hypothetical protein IJS03_02965 [Eubacterium sp.]|nr:hypothetical protein [Eubacterium sp.]